ncbi:MAG TPA: polysaccharide biosynthesis tyrosine autokinase [Sulfurospirillum arcachonense]|nr:polysaccharide biosynthesis tyrosine autokinase [Sulfurospirillum arcachonense]
MNIEYEGNPIKFKKILYALFKYKWINLLILLTFWALGLLYYKSQTPVYSVSATIEMKNVQNAGRDFFGNATGKAAGLETEIDIIKSNLLIQKTLKSLGNNVGYYKKDDSLQTQHLYHDKPFTVQNFIVYNPELYGKKITIKDLGNDKFSLHLESSMLGKLKSYFKEDNTFASFKKVYTFNKVAMNEDIAFKIVKNSNFKNENYAFILKSEAAALDQIKGNLVIAPASTDSTVLKLDFKDTIPQRAKDFLNKLIDNYMLYSVKSQTEIDLKKLSFVNKQIDAINGKLAQSENSLEGFKIENDISNIEAQIQEVITKKGLLNEKLQLEKINYKSIALLDREVKKGNYSVISSLEDRYPVLATLVQNLQQLIQKREGLLVNLTYNHPEVLSMSKNIKSAKSSILSIVGGIKKQVGDRVSALTRDVKVYSQMLKTFPSKEKELGRHERLFDVNDQVYNYLLQKQSELSIEKVSHRTNKNVLDYARLAKNLNLKLPFIFAFSTLLGLFTILLHTIMRTKLDVKIKTPDDIAESTDMPLYGIIPFVENKGTYNSAYVLDDATSTSSEAFRAIRTNLEYVVSPNGSKVILVTSSIPNEGKTVVSANLASVIGMSEKQVVILSLDLRRPEMHHKFGLSNKVGMSDVLSGKATLKDTVWSHEIYPNLNIITSGRIPPNPAELLSSSRMTEVIKELKKEYDYIILDTPPINYVSDAVALFKHADINLFVVKSDFTEKKHMNELNALVEKFGLDNSGIILNSVKKKYNKLEQFDYKYLYYEPL